MSQVILVIQTHGDSCGIERLRQCNGKCLCALIKWHKRTNSYTLSIDLIWVSVSRLSSDKHNGGSTFALSPGMTPTMVSL